jgi:hypothetical protein
MPYQPNVPQPTDTGSKSQGDLLANFQAIDSLIGINNYTFNSGNDGYHARLDMPAQSIAPVNPPGLVTVVANPSAYTTLTALSFFGDNGAAGIEMTSADKSTTGWTFLPSGILVKWGQTTANGLATITFPVAPLIPVFTSLLTVMLTVIDPAAADSNTFVRLTNTGAPTGFSVYACQRTTSTVTNVSFQYVAIGY